MKKIITIFATIFMVTCSIFAQTAGNADLESINSYSSIDTEVLQIEDKFDYLHPKAKTAKLTLEHTPLTGEVRFYYTCMASAYDQGEAMNTAMAVYEEFGEENKYKTKVYLSKDKTSYYKDERGVRMATYVSHVMFKR